MANKTSKHLEHHFGNMPMVEATEALELYPSQDDFSNAVRHDPRSCGFANCVRRVALSPKALFFKNYAYVARRNRQGVMCAFRYSTSQPLRAALEAYDKSGKYPDIGRPYRLLAPSKTKRRKAMTNAAKRWRKGDMGQAMLLEKRKESELRTAEADVERANAKLERLRDSHGTSNPRVAEARQQVTAARTIVATTRDELRAVRDRIADLRESSDYRGTGEIAPKVIDMQVRNGFASLVKAMRNDTRTKRAA